MRSLPTSPDPLCFEIDPQEVLRFQGYRRPSDVPTAQVLQILGNAIGEGRKIFRPRWVYREFPVASADASGLRLQDGPGLEIRGVSDRWGEVASVGVSACTIGGGIDERVEALLDERELPLAFMLDSLGSVVVEALAETLHRRLCADHLARGLKVSPRESPGYARWAIEEQRKLFALLPAGDIGLELNPYSIMTPRKSISFAVGIGPEAKMGASQSPCQSCDMRDCAYRRAPRRQPLAPAWASALGSLVLEFDHIKLAIP